MTSRLADAYDLVAEAFATLALELRAAEKPAAPSFEELPFADEPFVNDAQPPFANTSPAKRVHPDEWERQVDAEPHGSAAVCPAHNIEYRDGKYGKYCPSLGTDPKWTNPRGYCQITPKNAAAYLRQKAAA